MPPRRKSWVWLRSTIAMLQPLLFQEAREARGSAPQVLRVACKAGVWRQCPSTCHDAKLSCHSQSSRFLTGWNITFQALRSIKTRYLLTLIRACFNHMSVSGYSASMKTQTSTRLHRSPARLRASRPLRSVTGSGHAPKPRPTRCTFWPMQ